MCVVTGFARPVPGDWYEGGGQGVTQAAYRERPKRGFGRRWCESKSKKNENLKKYLVLFQGLLKLWHAAQADVYYLDFWKKL